jgi:hypothetical protein
MYAYIFQTYTRDRNWQFIDDNTSLFKTEPNFNFTLILSLINVI